MEQKEPVLVLYDREEEYARLFSEYLKRQKELPWQIHTYTRAEELLAGEKSGEVTMLVVAESSCEEALNTLQPTCQAILNESGTLRFHQFPNINKYQEAGQVWKELLALYVETTGIRMPLLCAEYKTRFIGMYSPVHRCLQSTFALSFAQLMAEKHPTLYLNFEHYVGIIELLPERQDRDLADLLYFLAGDEGKFPLRMQTVIQRKGNLDYIQQTMRGPALAKFDKRIDPKHPQTWLGLEVLNAYPDLDPHVGYVEFIAQYKQNNKTHRIHERSKFHREGGRWYYVDGEYLS